MSCMNCGEEREVNEKGICAECQSMLSAPVTAQSSTGTFGYKDPVTGKIFYFGMVALNKLRIGEYQRAISTALAGHVMKSMLSGFISAIVVVKAEDDMYEVVDGQHRVHALNMLVGRDIPMVPCLILPEEYRNLPLIYNVEKADDLKATCTKLYKLYMSHVESAGESMNEKALKAAALDSPYFITLAIAFCEFDLSSPSLVESPVKKLDTDFFTINLIDAVDTRRVMAQKVKELEVLVNDICANLGITDYNLKKAIISKSSQELWGRKRNLDVNFLDGMEQLIAVVNDSNWTWMAGR